MAHIQRIVGTLAKLQRPGNQIAKTLSTIQNTRPTAVNKEIAPTHVKTLYSNQAWLFSTAKIPGDHLKYPSNLMATRTFATTTSETRYVSPYELKKPPLKTIVLYNPSGHANNMAYLELSRAFPSIRIIQTQVPGRPIVKGISKENVLHIPKKSFGNMEIFKSELLKNPNMAASIKNGEVGFYAIWAPLAEDENVARDMQTLGLTWIGASPESMEQLGKIEYKTLCKEQGLPTSPFFVLQPDSIETMTAQFQSDYANSELNGQSVFIKSASGGGGRGTRKLVDTTNRDSIFEAINAVAKEGRVDDIYVEMALNFSGATLYQIELEVDSFKQVAPGGRLVFFNEKNQKVLEFGFTDAEITRFIPTDIYSEMRENTRIIAQKSGYTSRGTNEILIVKREDGRWEFYNSELNKRIQVEHEALSDLVESPSGHEITVSAEQVMRSCGYPAAPTEDLKFKEGVGVAAHFRLVAPSITRNGTLTYGAKVSIDQVICDMPGVNVVYNEGPLYSDTDAQFGRVTLTAKNWESMCEKLVELSQKLVIIGQNIPPDYLLFLNEFASHPDVQSFTLGCNKTFSVMAATPPALSPLQKTVRFAQGALTELIVNGYGPKGTYPTNAQVQDFSNMITELAVLPDVQTIFNDFLVSGDLNQYYIDLKTVLDAQGGGLKSVWPRDVCQEKISSESAAITAICRTIMEKIGASAGYVGYETGGAQQEVGAKNLFDPIDVLIAGCPSNMPANALTRSFWLNSLAKKSAEEVRFILQTYTKRIREHYNIPTENKVPWFPNLFHAGNHNDMDAVADIMLSIGITPIPNWAWGPYYTDNHLKGWINRQLDVFEKHGEKLQEIRIKNPGQQKEWTVETIWNNVQIIRHEYKARYGESAEPIVDIHNHDLNRGTAFSAAIIARDLLIKAQSEGYRYLIIDTAPASVPTHNNHDIVAEALTLSAKQKDSAAQLNTYASSVYGLLGRFEISSLPAKSPNWSTWAGGTGSSDRRFAADMGIEEKDIEAAKRMGEEVLQLGTIVTPYSEWSMRFGMICWKAGLQTADEVRTYIQTGQHIEASMANGATIGISKEILAGLEAWETLLPRPAIVEALLSNYGMSGTASENPSATLFDPKSLKKNLQIAHPGYPISDSDVTVATAFGSIGKELITAKAKGTDRSSFIANPLPLYTTIQEGEVFSHEGLDITYLGRETDSRTAMTTLTFKIGENQFTTVIRDKNLAQTLGLKEVAANVKADPSNPLELGISMPGKITELHIKEGDVLSLKNSRIRLLGVEAMKMQNTLTLDPETFIPSLIKAGLIKDKETIGSLVVKQISVQQGDTVELNDRYIVLSYQP